jgi:hypothetical protein
VRPPPPPIHCSFRRACPRQPPASLRQAFGSEATDVRKAVVAVLVALHQLLRSAFIPFAESYLNVQQQKLLQIYIDKANSGE